MIRNAKSEDERASESETGGSRISGGRGCEARNQLRSLSASIL